MSRYLIVFAMLAFAAAVTVAQESELSVATIMQDPSTYIGDWPSAPYWSEDGQTLYFMWNPKGAFPSDSLFKVTRDNWTPRQVLPEERRTLGPAFSGWHHSELVYHDDVKVYASRGDLYFYDRTDSRRFRLTQTRDAEQNPRFTPDGSGVVFARGNNLFQLDLEWGAITQLTDLRDGRAPSESEPDAQDAFLEAQQLQLFQVIREERKEDDLREVAQERETEALDLPPTHYLNDRPAQQLQIDPTERFVTFVTSNTPERSKRTRAMNFVTESGYAEELTARAKVGAAGAQSALFIQDLERDTTYEVNLHQLEGAYDVPAFLQEGGVELDSSKSKRLLYSYGPSWSADGAYAVLDVRTRDNKDRWIVRLHPETAELTVLDRQHDEAWIAGPGISWFGGASTLGWLPDNQHIYFQSEASGYSHLYIANVETGEVTQLTKGDFEVFAPQLSKDGSTWYFGSSEESPHVRHYYRMPVTGGTREQLTTMEGRNQVALSPQEDLLGVLQSVASRPPEIFVQTPKEAPERITHSQTDDWLSYPWRTPTTIRFEASDGIMVPAHVFEPAESNGAAVLFVHGAGYMQNVHDGWSSYYREYMFHNLLADLGYTVLQVDYRASAGYGRDWRTAIYRHMGGRDLQDYVDASKYITRTYGIGPDQIGIYGGSYGGFITLMALFTAPDYFGAGAALRSVTDWAHYNHTYTANILNTPEADSLAYARSSPINFAEGLEDPLLMPHGMVDLNVQFQDIVRLGQRLIELGKEHWEIALYPVEGHGFQEPSSWTDEYRRILKLFETHIRP